MDILVNVSKNSLILFQLNNNIDADGKLDLKHVLYCLNKQKLLKIYKTNKKTPKEVENTNKTYSQEIYDAQIILKDLRFIFIYY